jgi:hypothetical protein
VAAAVGDHLHLLRRRHEQGRGHGVGPSGQPGGRWRWSA